MHKEKYIMMGEVYQLSVVPQDSKNLTEKKKQQQKHRTCLKSFRESGHAMWF